MIGMRRKDKSDRRDNKRGRLNRSSRRENIIDMEKYKKDKRRGLRKTTKSKNTIKKPVAKKRKPSKKHRKSSDSKSTTIIIFMTILVLILLTIIIYRYSQISITKYDIIDISNEISEIDNEIKVLNIKVDQVSSSKIMEEKAKNLGMEFRNKENLVYVLVE